MLLHHNMVNTKLSQGLPENGEEGSRKKDLKKIVSKQN